ncbi:CCA tRNA nucleotidyltransferase [Atopobacter phocae]|uniref:CCA tRNA nucleotidyltransferase n=1 Tax=Atopobacter phocae TaxID=136492 RepID=UPI00047047F5|nr:CCA tRNA nucleotidyltransferase [Atopobacter phocae]
MQVKLTHELFQEAIPVIEQIEQAGFEAYFVGGSVRDIILDRPIHDIDIATSATPEEIKSIFSRTIDVGIDHGTVMVLFEKASYEITTYRSEGTYSDHRRPDQVEFVRDLKEDLLRRDFTMNALALSRTGQIIDYYDGQGDIKRQQIACVGNPYERFNEDALRIMRALRFMAQLNFTISHATLEAIRALNEQLKLISIERMTIEWHKLCLGKAYPQAIRLMLSSGVAEQLPAIDYFRKSLHILTEHPIQWRDEADVWTTVLFLSNHSSDMVHHIQTAYKLSNQLTQQIKQRLLALNQLNTRLDKKWSNKELYELNVNIESAAHLAAQLFEDFKDDDASLRYNTLPIHSKRDIVVTGKELKQLIPPSSIYSVILNDIEEKILNHHLQNEQNELLDYIQFNYKDYLCF